MTTDTPAVREVIVDGRKVKEIVIEVDRATNTAWLFQTPLLFDDFVRYTCGDGSFELKFSKSPFVSGATTITDSHVLQVARKDGIFHCDCTIKPRNGAAVSGGGDHDVKPGPIQPGG